METRNAWIGTCESGDEDGKDEGDERVYDEGKKRNSLYDPIFFLPPRGIVNCHTIIGRPEDGNRGQDKSTIFAGEPRREAEENDKRRRREEISK